MFVKETTEIHLHQRESKLGNVHNFKRRRGVYHFKCDCCGKEFMRDKSKVTPSRASNNFHHVCAKCDVHKYAQQVGVNMRKIYKLDASSIEVKL
jgi:hypothetical protein